MILSDLGGGGGGVIERKADTLAGSCEYSVGHVQVQLSSDLTIM